MQASGSILDILTGADGEKVTEVAPGWGHALKKAQWPGHGDLASGINSQRVIRSVPGRLGCTASAWGMRASEGQGLNHGSCNQSSVAKWSIQDLQNEVGHVPFLPWIWAALFVVICVGSICRCIDTTRISYTTGEYNFSWTSDIMIGRLMHIDTSALAATWAALSQLVRLAATCLTGGEHPDVVDM